MSCRACSTDWEDWPLWYRNGEIGDDGGPTLTDNDAASARGEGAIVGLTKLRAVGVQDEVRAQRG